MNPLEKVVSLVKTGDKKTLAIGAVAVGGGVGLFVYLRRRGQGAGNPTDAMLGTPADQGNGLADYAGGDGGGGGSGGLDLGLTDMLGGSPGDLGLPVLADSTTLLPGDTSSPLGLTASPMQPIEPFPSTDFSAFQLPTLAPLGSSGGIGATDFGNSLGSEGALPMGSDPFTVGASNAAQGGTGGGSAAQAAQANVQFPENTQGLQHGPVAPAPVPNAGFVHAPITQAPVQMPNATLVHSPVTGEVTTALSHTTVDRTAGLMHDQIVLQQRQAEQMLQHQEQQRLADYAAAIQHSIAVSRQAAIDEAQRLAGQQEIQRLAAFNNLRNALLRQQATGNFGATLLGRTAAESNALGISGVHAIMPTPTQARVQYTPAPAYAPAVHAPAPVAPAVHAPAPTVEKRS
jgi:hypothetical protein